MSALPELAFESTRTLTQEEFAAWVAARWRGDLNHYELLEGRVVMTPPAGYPHGSIEAALGPFTRQGDRFDAGRTFEEGQLFSSAVLAGLDFDVASVL